MQGEKVEVKKFFVLIIGLVFSLSLFSCAPLVKTDLKSLKDNPEKYQGKRVVVTTDLKSVVEKPEDYLGKKIELTGYVKYKGFRNFTYWNFILKDEEVRSLRCYEREYRIRSWIMPVMALRRAERENEQITAVGKLEKGLEIELDWIKYKGQRFNTDYKPPRIILPFYSFSPWYPKG